MPRKPGEHGGRESLTGAGQPAPVSAKHPMSILVTGGSSFVGRHVIDALVELPGDGPIFVLVRKGVLPEMAQLSRRWHESPRIVPLVGDLTAPLLGVDPHWLAEHTGRIDHLLHLVPRYDVDASAARNEERFVASTSAVIEMAERLRVGRLHHLSSAAVAGDFSGLFDESMFDVGQRLTQPEHRIAFEAEREVRERLTVPWRIYRTSHVLGNSVTGEMDRPDGPYRFFPMVQLFRDRVPSCTPVVGLDLGSTNVVPVDYVGRAVAALVLREGLDGRTFHLVGEYSIPRVDVINTVATAAHAVRIGLPLRGLWRPDPGRSLALRTLYDVADRVLSSRPVATVLDTTVGRTGLPTAALRDLTVYPRLSADTTRRELSAVGVGPPPPLASYARTLWDFWEARLGSDAGRDVRARRALHDRVVVVGDPGHGLGMAIAIKLAQVGATPLLVAGPAAASHLRAALGAVSGSARVYAAELTDPEQLAELAKQLTADHDSIDLVLTDPADVTGRVGFGTGVAELAEYLSASGADAAVVSLPRVHGTPQAESERRSHALSPAQAADRVLRELTRLVGDG